MDNKEAIHKLEFMRNAYQKLIDEKVDSGRLVGTDVTGTWKAETPLDDAYKEHIDALSLAIAALEQQMEDNEWCLDCKEYDKEQHCCHRFTKVIRQAVEEHQREWSDSKWIPATENPKKPNYQFDTYLVYTKYERFGVADFFADGSWIGYDIDGDQINGDEITAWRPLPEPYQEDKA